MLGNANNLIANGSNFNWNNANAWSDGGTNNTVPNANTAVFLNNQTTCKPNHKIDHR